MSSDLSSDRYDQVGTEAQVGQNMDKDKIG